MLEESYDTPDRGGWSREPSGNISTTAAFDLRKEAEDRARSIKMNKQAEAERQLKAKVAAMKAAELAKKRREDEEAMMRNAADITMNRTPADAKLNEIDYRLNGDRARANSGDFIRPRWIPDEEVAQCLLCNVQFDWLMRRKHHCRRCGNIVCADCSVARAMLPQEFGMNDPQRVCASCNGILAPMQSHLANTLANHQRVNIIDTTKCLQRHMNMPFSLTLDSEIRKAVYSICNLFEFDGILRDGALPRSLLPAVKGIAFLTVVKAGFGFAAKIGTGLVVSRLPSGEWSAPSAIGTIGLSWGALIGADITDFVVFLNTIDAVRAFAGVGQVSIGAGIDVAVGPLGRSTSADITIGGYGYAPAFSYAHSRGFFAGVSLQGSVVLSRSDVNYRFYGRNFTPMQILGGQVDRPVAAEPLYNALNRALALEPNPQYEATPVKARNKTSNDKSDPMTSLPACELFNDLPKENEPTIRANHFIID